MDNWNRLQLIGEGYDALHPGKNLGFEEVVDILFNRIMPEHKINDNPGMVLVDGNGTVSVSGRQFGAGIDEPFIMFRPATLGYGGVEITHLTPYDEEGGSRINLYPHTGNPNLCVDNLDSLATMHYATIGVKINGRAKQNTLIKIGKPKRVRMVHLRHIEGEKKNTALWNLSFRMLGIRHYRKIKLVEDGIRWEREVPDYGAKESVLRVGYAGSMPSSGYVSVDFVEPIPKQNLACLSDGLRTLAVELNAKRILLRSAGFEWPQVVKYLLSVKEL